ncbi:cytochrome c oxidase subunit 3, partial [Staphylococcus aureus]|uniref:cytochrome c oxidase subunit 3 n=1 Tax=Staphylococcus aureus TaxID=1280 RepID=UPI0038B39AB7
MKGFHLYHLVELSPWPLTGAVGGFLLTRGIVKVFYYKSYELVLVVVLFVFLTIYK